MTFLIVSKIEITEPPEIVEFVEQIIQIVHHVKVYNDECNSIIKETKLFLAALDPPNFEKQKLQLACNIFNKKTVSSTSRIFLTPLFCENANKDLENDEH